MTIESFEQAAVTLLGLWFLGVVALSAYRYARHALSNLSRGRRMADWLFEPVLCDHFCGKTFDHFQQFSPAMRSLGFATVGDFRLRRSPGPALARYFLSEDGTSVGEISDFLGDRSYGFFTIFDDGTYLETSAIRTPYRMPQSRLLIIQAYPGMALDELYARHLQHVCEHQEYGRCAAVELAAEQIDAAANYGRRLVRSHILCRWRRVPPPEFLAERIAQTAY